MPAISILSAVMLAAPAAPLDYDDPERWICRPDREDVCTSDLSTAIVTPEGLAGTETPPRATDPAADCFYVYPTVSADRGGNSDIEPGENEELLVTAVQFARFSTVCRTFAPLYRQYTTGSIRNRILFGRESGDRELAYGDVREAFANYLVNDNGGRPFVLVGHSQGSRHLRRLIEEEIDGTALQDRMVSAILPGTDIALASGSAAGDFHNVAPCRAPEQTGCFISYAAFPADEPAPADGLFGTRDENGRMPACTNPAALGGGGAALGSVFTTAIDVGGKQRGWAKGRTLDTTYVKTPGLVSGECVKTENTHFLAVTVDADPEDDRTDEIGGKLKVGPLTLDDWGLHLIDINLVQDDLIGLVREQVEAFTATPTGGDASAAE